MYIEVHVWHANIVGSALELGESDIYFFLISR